MPLTETEPFHISVFFRKLKITVSNTKTIFINKFEGNISKLYFSSIWVNNEYNFLKWGRASFADFMYLGNYHQGSRKAKLNLLWKTNETRVAIFHFLKLPMECC